MAEKGILITPQPGGVSVAARDAIEPDDNTNARIIQQYDYSNTPIALEYPTTGAARNGIVSSDSFNLDNVPADMTDNLIDCRDCTKLVVNPRFHGGTEDSMVLVVPMLFDESDNLISWLTEKEVSAGGSYLTSNFARAGVGIGYSRVWTLVGTAKVGLFAGSVDLYGATGIDLWGFAV